MKLERWWIHVACDQCSPTYTIDSISNVKFLSSEKFHTQAWKPKKKFRILHYIHPNQSHDRWRLNRKQRSIEKGNCKPTHTVNEASGVSIACEPDTFAESPWHVEKKKNKKKKKPKEYRLWYDGKLTFPRNGSLDKKESRLYKRESAKEADFALYAHEASWRSAPADGKTSLSLYRARERDEADQTPTSTSQTLFLSLNAPYYAFYKLREFFFLYLRVYCEKRQDRYANCNGNAMGLLR